MYDLKKLNLSVKGAVENGPTAFPVSPNITPVSQPPSTSSTTLTTTNNNNMNFIQTTSNQSTTVQMNNSNTSKETITKLFEISFISYLLYF